MEEKGNTTNTILWIIVLVLVTLLINGGGDVGGIVDASLQAPNAEDRLSKTLAPVEQPIRVLNNLCTPEVRELIEQLRDAHKSGDVAAQNRVSAEIFDRLDGTLGKLVASDFVEGEPVRVALKKYAYITSVARHQAKTLHGISDIFRSWIGDCGKRLID